MTGCFRCGVALPAEAQFCPACGAPQSEQRTESSIQKHVIVAFVDLVSSTALAERLEPEIHRRLLEAYFARVSGVLWKYGATIEKFIGDAVMAVFGVPIAREVDGHRAVEAAKEIHDAVAELNEIRYDESREIQVRIGLFGGDALVTRAPDGQFVVTGDVTNVAARLEQSAPPGQTLAGGSVPHLAALDVTSRPALELELRGKSEQVAAWLVTDDGRTVAPTGATTSMIGRERELTVLQETVDRVAQNSESAVVAVTGEAGIGKSRLIHEFVSRQATAAFLGSRCRQVVGASSYWPIRDLLKALATDWERHVTMLLGHDEQSVAVVNRLRAAIGDSGDAVSIDDIAWAVAQLFGALLERQPLIISWEDLHWGERAFLDLVERLCRRTAGMQKLVMIVSYRPEFLEKKRFLDNRTVNIDIGRLSDAASRELVASMASCAPAQFDPLIRVGEGNPLILEQLITTSVGESGGLPVTVKSMFEARLDQLSPSERLFCARAAIMGREFWAEAVWQLDHDFAAQHNHEATIVQRLGQRGIIREVDGAAGGPSHQFSHGMLRETLYYGMPKRERLTGHRALAHWLHDCPGITDSERAELRASHLFTAYELQNALVLDHAADPELAWETASAVLVAGDQCLLRGDTYGLLRHMAQAVRVLPDGDERLRGVAIKTVRGHLANADTTGADAVVRRVSTKLEGDRIWGGLERILTAMVNIYADPATVRTCHGVVAQTVRERTLHGDDESLACLYELEALAFAAESKIQPAEHALSRAIDCAARSANSYDRRRFLGGWCELAFWGATPAEEAIGVCEELLSELTGERDVMVPVLGVLGALRALQADVVPGKAIVSRAVQIADDLELPHLAGTIRQFSGLVFELEADYERAAGEYLEGADLLRGSSDMGRASLITNAARVYARANDMERARQLSHQLESDVDDVNLRAATHSVTSLVAAAEQQHDLARELAVKVESLVPDVADPRTRGDLLVDLARVYHAVGQPSVRDDRLGAAIEEYRAKGAVRCVEISRHAVRRWAEVTQR